MRWLLGTDYDLVRIHLRKFLDSNNLESQLGAGSTPSTLKLKRHGKNASEEDSSSQGRSGDSSGVSKEREQEQRILQDEISKIRKQRDQANVNLQVSKLLVSVGLGTFALDHGQYLSLSALLYEEMGDVMGGNAYL